VNLRDVTWRVQSSPVAKAVVRQVLDLRSIWAETAQLSPVSLGGACAAVCRRASTWKQRRLGLIAYGTDVRGCYSLLTETGGLADGNPSPPPMGRFRG
jgi:hypothetical protein